MTYTGRIGWMTVGDATRAARWRIRVRILAERNVYGRDEYLVTPVNGKGEDWVHTDRVSFKGAGQAPAPSNADSDADADADQGSGEGEG